MFRLPLQSEDAAKRPDTVAVLDIGASKTVCLIGQDDPAFGVRLLGHGFGVSAGLRGGSIVDLEATEQGIRSAVEKAERSAGVTVRSVAVNVSARSLQSRHVNAAMEAGGEITERSKARVLAAAVAKVASPHHAVVHAVPLAWSVDEAEGIADPAGMYGRRLGVDLHAVLAELGPMRNLAHCVERSHLRLSGVTASPYAAGRGVLSEDELDLGATVIDLGGGVTTLAVFRDRALLSVSALPVGGATLTGDIARGLSTPVEAAERIKTLYASTLEGTEDVSLPCPPMGSDDELAYRPRSELIAITRARVEETFEILRDRLRRSGLEDFAGRRVVLTGGGAELLGVRELAETVFGKAARVARPSYLQGLGSTLNGPAFSTATGMLRVALGDDGDLMGGAPDLSGRTGARGAAGGNVVQRTARWLVENF